jgi:atypical dual specificity phosphatase
MRRLMALFSEKPFNFGWVLEDLAVSGRPVTRSQIQWLLQSGISAILSLTEDRIPPYFLEGLDILYEHIPVPDHHPPYLQDIQRAIEFIDDALSRGRKVLVHCAAGQGRSGTVVAAYVMYKKGLTSDEALYWIRKTRPGSVDPVQEEILRAFETFLKLKKERGSGSG